MTLGDLIKWLEAQDPSIVVPVGFAGGESWRGIYAEASFEPAENVTVGQMLSAATALLNTTVTGYKGGEFKMSEYVDVHIDFYSECRDRQWEILLGYMIGKPTMPGQR